jgi:hypothetical protein
MDLRAFFHLAAHIKNYVVPCNAMYAKPSGINISFAILVQIVPNMAEAISAVNSRNQS